METRVRWKHEEDIMLLQALKETEKTHNLMEGFRLAAKRLGKDPKACCSRYYTIRKNGKLNSYLKEMELDCLFISITNSTALVNGKIVTNNAFTKKLKPTLWQSIINLFKLKK